MIDEAVNTGKGANSIISMLHHYMPRGMSARGGFRGGGFRGLQPPPPKWSESQYKISTTNVLRYAQALIYIAKSLVVVVVSSKQVVKPLSRQAVVQPEVLHLLECLLGHSTVLGSR